MKNSKKFDRKLKLKTTETGNRGLDDRVIPVLSDSKRELFSTIESGPEFREDAFLKRYAKVIENSLIQ